MYDAQWPRGVRSAGLLRSSVRTPARRSDASSRGKKVDWAEAAPAAAGEGAAARALLVKRRSPSAKSAQPGGGPSSTSTSPHRDAPRRYDPHTCEEAQADETACELSTRSTKVAWALSLLLSVVSFFSF